MEVVQACVVVCLDWAPSIAVLKVCIPEVCLRLLSPDSGQAARRALLFYRACAAVMPAVVAHEACQQGFTPAHCLPTSHACLHAAGV